jgi:hypothetical protein
MAVALDPVDTIWLVLGSCMIFGMQLGFAMLETGCIGQHSNHQSGTLLKVRIEAAGRSDTHLTRNLEDGMIRMKVPCDLAKRSAP